MGANIVVLGFEGEYAAEGMLEDLQRMQEDGLIEIVDAVVTSRGPGQHVEIKQMGPSETGKYALGGTGIGLLAGLLLGGPIIGLVGGATVGAITGKIKSHGLDDGFVKEVSEWLRPHSSALFLMVGAAKGEEVLKHLEPFQARVLTTTLTAEAEAQLKAALDTESYRRVRRP